MCPIIVRLKQSCDNASWDRYVYDHSEACVYHLSGWQTVIEGAYGHRTYYLIAEEGEHGAIVGVLPLVHLKSLLFGSHLVSLPFFDIAGVLCDDLHIGVALIEEALKLARRLKTQSIELRQSNSLTEFLSHLEKSDLCVQSISTKERLLMELPKTPDSLMSGFKSKLRSQIKSPIKKGLKIRIGGCELLKDFYSIFAVNMRDLGSPVHSIDMMAGVLKTFPEKARVFIVHQDNRTLACSLAVDFGTLMANPWASSLRRYRRLNANMLLYWSMLEYAIERGLHCFDFGRSSPDEGTYRFKLQWGASPKPTYWYNLSTSDRIASNASPDKNRFDHLIAIWQKLPVSLTRIIGPAIRKRISL
jgi:serine/alanine adding enzyme